MSSSETGEKPPNINILNHNKVGDVFIAFSPVFNGCGLTVIGLTVIGVVIFALKFSNDMITIIHAIGATLGAICQIALWIIFGAVILVILHKCGLPLATGIKHLFKPKPEAVAVAEHFAIYTDETGKVRIHDHNEDKTIHNYKYDLAKLQEGQVTTVLPERVSVNPDECLDLAPGFTPHADEILSGRGALFGISGSGKSNSVARLTERLGDFDVPLVVGDTDGEYGSLGSYLPHGQSIGAHNLAPADASNFAHSLLDNHIQAVLDLTTYASDDEAAMVMVNLIAGLKAWEESHDPVSCMFLLEEASFWLPQNISESRLDRQILNSLQAAFFADVVRRGRKRGIGLTLATQRPAELDKRALQTSWKLLHRQTEPRDLKVYAEMGIEKAEDVISLRNGEAYAFTSTMSKRRIQMHLRQSPHGAHTPGLASIRNHRVTDDLVVQSPTVVPMPPLPQHSHPTRQLLMGAERKVFDACWQLQQAGQRVSSRNVEDLTGIQKDTANKIMNDLADQGLIIREKRTV